MSSFEGMCFHSRLGTNVAFAPFLFFLISIEIISVSVLETAEILMNNLKKVIINVFKKLPETLE